MPATSNPDLLLAQTLAAPFSPRSQGKPLSLRRLPDGGMVVIATDGRKLWFSADEVETTRAVLEEKTGKRSQATFSHRAPVKLTTPADPDAQPHSGKPLKVALAADMKVKHDHPGNP